MRRPRRQIAASDIDLVAVGGKPICLEFLIKVVLDWTPIDAPLMKLLSEK